ncbi:MAG: HPr family phosphocarrier protein [Planctomycetota bacterium]
MSPEDNPTTPAATQVEIDPEMFRAMVARRGRTLLSLGGLLSATDPPTEALTRPFVAELLSQAMQMEELVDAYGARTNRRWYPYRSLLAGVRRFADVSNELLHVKHSVPSYRLLSVERDFLGDTDRALEFTGGVLLQASRDLLALVGTLDLPVPAPADPDDYAEQLPPGRLPADLSTRTNEAVSETAARLATAFLNLAAESKVVHKASRAEPSGYAALVPEPISEETLRELQNRFHNCQSLYDTYVSGTEAEDADCDLPILRGHVSVVYHLLQIATAYAHYYERHVNIPDGDHQPHHRALVAPEPLLTALMEYALSYASAYITRAEQLCRRMLHRYAEVGRVEVPVPRYRGFHVRPSTLMAKIVQHYGSEVTMELGGETYDAGSPMDVFRANEQINACKRRRLVEAIAKLPMLQHDWPGADVHGLVQQATLKLAEQGQLFIYEQPLRIPESPGTDEGTLLQRVTSEIARLQAMGKIDICTDMTVTLVGDRRVLADIKLLAESGWGEDNFGNNVPLPEELSYLRR